MRDDPLHIEPLSDEQEAQAEADAARAKVDSLEAKRSEAALAIPRLEQRRGQLARELAVNGGNESEFAAACSELDVGRSRLETLAEVCDEATAERTRAYAVLSAAQGPPPLAVVPSSFHGRRASLSSIALRSLAG